MKRTARVHSHSYGVVWQAADRRHRHPKPTWRVKFRCEGKIVSGASFADEETAARWSDVARQWTAGDDAPLNYDGTPPPGWSRISVLQWLVEHNRLSTAKLRQILRRHGPTRKS